jgi:hypothetical protein
MRPVSGAGTRFDVGAGVGVGSGLGDGLGVGVAGTRVGLAPSVGDVVTAAGWLGGAVLPQALATRPTARAVPARRSDDWRRMVMGSPGVGGAPDTDAGEGYPDFVRTSGTPIP